MALRIETCRTCGRASTVADCSLCGRPFVVTVAHEEGRRRRYEDAAAAPPVADRDVWICDLDVAKALETSMEAVKQGLQQATCPGCHTQMV